MSNEIPTTTGVAQMIGANQQHRLEQTRASLSSYSGTGKTVLADGVAYTRHAGTAPAGADTVPAYGGGYWLSRAPAASKSSTIYVPDLLKGSSGPVENMQRLNTSLAQWGDKREFYFPAEYGVYLFAHDNPLSGNSGIFYHAGQTLRGDGAATVLKYATANAQYGHFLRPKIVAGVPHKHARLLDMTIDHNASDHIAATISLDISGTHYLHTRLIWRNIPLAAAFADTPESAPTVGAVFESPQVYKSFGVGLSFFNACEGFQIIGAARFEDLVDDCVAFQEAATGYQRGHTTSGSMTFRRCGQRHYVAGVGGAPPGYSASVALRLIGCENINLQAAIDADGMANGVVSSMGTKALGTAKYNGGRKNRGIIIGAINARRTGKDTPAIDGHPNPAHAITIIDSVDVQIIGGSATDNVGNGIDVDNSQNVTVRDFYASGNAVGLWAKAGSTVRVEGGAFDRNQAGIVAENAGSWIEVRGVRTGSNVNAVYAASGSLISGHDVVMTGNTGSPIVRDGGTVEVTGIRTKPGPLQTNGYVDIAAGDVVAHLNHWLSEKPRNISLTSVDSAVTAGVYDHPNPDLFTVRLPAPQQAVTRVAWKAEL